MSKKEEIENKLADVAQESVKASRKIVKRVLSFDVYFQGLMKKNPKVYAHHKAPMRTYAESKGLSVATEEEFDRIFRLY